MCQSLRCARRRKGIWALLGMAWLCAAVAVGDELVPLTLDEALARAEQQSPELAEARAMTEAAAARAQAAGRGAWPRVSLVADGVRTDNPARAFASTLNRGGLGPDDFALGALNTPAPVSHLTTAASVEMPIDVFRRASAMAQGARAGARALTAVEREARQRVRFAVIEAYQRAALARAAVAVAERVFEGARARERDLATRVEQGAALTADLLRARARRRQREADLVERREQWRADISRLGRATGAPAGVVYDAVVPAAMAAVPEASVEQWLQGALDVRPSLAVAREQQAAAEWNESAERRAGLPEIGAYAQLQDDRNASTNARSYAFGVGVRWPVFDAGRGGRVAAARAEVRAAAARTRAAMDQVRLEVETAFRRARSARERHAAARGGAEEAREALRIVQERRKEGMATLTDELETEAAGLAAEFEELSSASQVFVAAAALRHAAGQLE
jgi:outer membrane protein